MRTALVVVKDWDKLSDGEKTFFSEHCTFLAINDTGPGMDASKTGHTTVVVNKEGHEGFGRSHGLTSTLVEWFAGIFRSREEMDGYERSAEIPI